MWRRERGEKEEEEERGRERREMRGRGREDRRREEREGCGGGRGRGRPICCLCEVPILSYWAEAEWSWPHFRTVDIWHSAFPSYLGQVSKFSEKENFKITSSEVQVKILAWTPTSYTIFASGNAFLGLIFITIEIRRRLSLDYPRAKWFP